MEGRLLHSPVRDWEALQGAQCDWLCADPLIMDNGLDLIDMMCSCYESPEDTSEEAVQYNFSQSINICEHPFACPYNTCKAWAL